MNRFAVIIAALMVIFALIPPCVAETLSVDESFAKANELFDEADAILEAGDVDKATQGFKEACAAYESMIENGVVDGRVYYNLGNTYYRLGQPGKAIAAYQHGRRLLPRDPGIAQNLQLVENSTEDKLTRPALSGFIAELLFWHVDLNYSESRLLLLVVYALLWVSAFAWLFARRRGIVWVCGILLCITLACILSVVIKGRDRVRPTMGVVIVQTGVVRSGDGDEYPERFTLREGAQFRIDESRGKWHSIELVDGNTGWVKDVDVETL
ncbi:tetratricopeptide repeat protein [Candidatus Hydrogenedentota bacterium]